MWTTRWKTAGLRFWSFYKMDGTRQRWDEIHPSNNHSVGSKALSALLPDSAGPHHDGRPEGGNLHPQLSARLLLPALDVFTSDSIFWGDTFIKQPQAQSCQIPPYLSCKHRCFTLLSKEHSYSLPWGKQTFQPLQPPEKMPLWGLWLKCKIVQIFSLKAEDFPLSLGLCSFMW